MTQHEWKQGDVYRAMTSAEGGLRVVGVISHIVILRSGEQFLHGTEMFTSTDDQGHESLSAVHIDMVRKPEQVELLQTASQIVNEALHKEDSTSVNG